MIMRCFVRIAWLPAGLSLAITYDVAGAYDLVAPLVWRRVSRSD